jgi:hypothetical protein
MKNIKNIYSYSYPYDLEYVKRVEKNHILTYLKHPTAFVIRKSNLVNNSVFEVTTTNQKPTVEDATAILVTKWE